MKKILMMVGVFVLVLSLGATAFADALKAPIQILSDLTAEDVFTLRASLEGGRNLRVLAEEYGVTEAFEEAIKDNIEIAIDALVAAGELTVAEGESVLRALDEGKENRELRQAYAALKKEYLKDPSNREKFSFPAESLSALTGERPLVLRGLLKDQRSVAIAFDYGVLEAFEEERKAENISLIEALYNKGIITEVEKNTYVAMVESYDYLENQGLKNTMDLIKKWLRENTEGPFSHYRALFKSPVEIYAGLIDESVEVVESLLEEETLRALVIENDLTDAFLEARINNIKEIISALESDGLMTIEEKNAYFETLSKRHPRSIRITMDAIKQVLKQ